MQSCKLFFNFVPKALEEEIQSNRRRLQEEAASARKVLFALNSSDYLILPYFWKLFCFMPLFTINIFSHVVK